VRRYGNNARRQESGMGMFYEVIGECAAGLGVIAFGALVVFGVWLMVDTAVELRK
jgi:hypothetical protein